MQIPVRARRRAALARPRTAPRTLRWALLLCVVVMIGAGGLSQHGQMYLIGGAIALPIFLACVRHPYRALVALVIFLPLEEVAFGFLLGMHVPASLLKGASYTKETLAASIIVAGAREVVKSGRKLGAVDKWALGYVGVVTAYLLFPHLFSPTHLSFHIRLLAWRQDCVYVLVFLGARHAPMTSDQRRRFWKVVLALGGLIAALGCLQAVATHTFDNDLLNQGHATQYLTDVIKNGPAAAASDLAYITSYSNHVSSIMFSPFDMADYLVMCLAVGAELIARARRSWYLYPLLGVILAALFFSHVRADALAAIVILVITLVPGPRRPTADRIKLIGALLLAGLVLVPALAGTRFLGHHGASLSSSQHITEITDGFKAMTTYPLGGGLGVNPVQGQSYLAAGDQGRFTTDNAITQTGVELGFLALIPWLIFLALALLGIWRRSRAPDPEVAGAGLALLAILIAGQFHHVFLTFPVPWTLWAGVGLSLSYRDGEARSATTPGDSATTIRVTT